jgi:hypothetical protein
MNKKPLVIIMFSIIYLFSPLFIILQAAFIHNIPILGFNNIFNFLLASDKLILLIYPVCAVSIFFVKKWGWYLFIVLSIVLIGYNIGVYLLNPRYNILMIIFYNVVLTCSAGVFFRKNVIAPYFNPRLRWWENDERYHIDLFAEIHVLTEVDKADILDISVSGCFITPSVRLLLGEVYQITLNWIKKSILVKAKVMRISSAKEIYRGYGIMFMDLDESEKSFIREIIHDLHHANLEDSVRLSFDEKIVNNSNEILVKGLTDSNSRSLRFKTTHRVIFIEHNFIARIIDFSKSGVLIELLDELEIGKIYEFVIDCLNYKLFIKGKVVRESKSDHYYSYGILFVDTSISQEGYLKEIVYSLKKAGFRHRLMDAKPVSQEVINKSVENTPYKITRIFKKNIVP